MITQKDSVTSPRRMQTGDRHYRAYVGPPIAYDIVSALQFNLLTTFGLRDFHTLLDVGCGSLRLGRLAMAYLRPGKYYGIEPNQWLIEEGIEKECGRDLVRIKRPRFSYNGEFRLTEFEVEFDFLIAQSIFTHAAKRQIGQCLSEAAGSMHSRSIFLANYMKGDSDYEGDQWVYPDCVPYREQTFVKLAAQHGLSCASLDLGKTTGATWLLFRRGDDLAGPVSRRPRRSFRVKFGWPARPQKVPPATSRRMLASLADRLRAANPVRWWKNRFKR